MSDSLSTKYTVIMDNELDSDYIIHTCRINVIGVGEGGISAVAAMMSQNQYTKFWAVDTDGETLSDTPIPHRLQLGEPHEWTSAMMSVIKHADLNFIVVGMGGKTGLEVGLTLGGLSKDYGALTIGVVIRPFSDEGTERCDRAAMGIELFTTQMDIVIVIHCDEFLSQNDQLLSPQAAFSIVNQTLALAVSTIADAITKIGIIGADFADFRAVLADGGLACFAMGEGEGEFRARDAAQMAITGARMESSLASATAVVFNVWGGLDMNLREVNVVAENIYEVVDPNVNIIFQAIVDENISDKIRVGLISIDANSIITPAELENLIELGRCGSLIHLNLDRHQLQTLPASIANLTMLVTLDLGNNSLTDLSILQTLPNLQTVIFRRVGLSRRYWTKLDQWKAQWLLDEKNVEVKRLLIEQIGYEQICQELNAVTIDSWREYTLLKIDEAEEIYTYQYWYEPHGELEISREAMVLLKMTCPSTHHIHILRVPPDLTTAEAAIMWVNHGIHPDRIAVAT
jgi:cell division GTPase FtsZ